MARRKDNLQIVLNSLDDFTADKVIRLVVNSAANLIEDTPRDLSWARNNWIPEIGPGPTDPEGDPESAGSVAAKQQQAIALIATTYKIGMGVVSLTNNVPYILPLNAGSSKQAPAGFVQAAILRAVQESSVGGSLKGKLSKSKPIKRKGK